MFCRHWCSALIDVLPYAVFVFDTINRSWQSWLVSIIGAQELFGFLPSNTHDWRLFITPEELTKLMKEFNLIVDESAYIGIYDGEERKEVNKREEEGKRRRERR